MRLTWRSLLAGVVGSLVLLALIWRPAPVPPAEAQGVGILSRVDCTAITSPAANQTVCWDQTARTWRFYNGTAWATLSSTNVQTFGATGNGTTDDTAAINAAISSGSGLVMFPAGVYRVTSTITITSGVQLIGMAAGPGAVLASSSNATYHGAIIDHDFNGDLFNITGVSGFVEPSVGTTIQNLLLRQINGAGVGASGRCIVAVAGSDTFKPSWVRIDRVNCETGTGHNDWTWGVYLDGSLTTGFATGLRDTWITNSRFNSGANGTGEIFGDTVANLFIDNVELNGTNTNVQLTGADAAHASTGAFITNTNTNGSLVLTRATNVFVTGGSWTSVSMGANCNQCIIAPNFITNTPATPSSANNVIAAYISGVGKYTTLTASGDSFEYRTNGLGLRNNTTAFIGTLDNQQLNFITNNTANNSINQSGILTAGQGITYSGGTGFTAGKIFKDTNQGLALVGVAGASNDFNLLSAAGASILINPTGTSQLKMPATTAGLQIGAAPTGGDQGAGTLNVASATYANGQAAIVASATGPNVVNLRGISQTGTSARNLRGTCTFAAASTCAVAFTSNEPDATYFVALGPQATVAANVHPYGITSKAASGFTITATVSNSNLVDWIIVR